MLLRSIKNGGKRHKTWIVGSRNLVITKLLALCLLLTLALKISVSASSNKRHVSKLNWPEADLQACVKVTCWKSAQIMNIVKHFTSSDHFITTGLVHEHEGFDCEVNSPKLVCPYQDSKMCIIRISQRDICCFSEYLESYEAPQELVLVTHGHDNLGSPVTPNPGTPSQTLYCFEKILQHPRVSRYYVSQHKVSYRHPKLHFIPIGLGTSIHSLKSKLSEVEIVRMLLAQQRLLSKSCQEKTCVLSPIEVNMNVEGIASSKHRHHVFEAISRSFPLIENHYNSGLNGDEMLQLFTLSAFVLSPSGTHFDCWRHYEALISGSIPIVDDHFTLREILGDLPVMFVDDWSTFSWNTMLDFLEKHVHFTNSSVDRLGEEFWTKELYRSR